MNHPEGESLLPKVKDEDFHSIIFTQELLGDTQAWLDHLETSNNALFNQLRMRAFTIAQEQGNTFQTHRQIMILAAFVIEILEVAAKREKEDSQSSDINDGGDDEDRPLSA